MIYFFDGGVSGGGGPTDPDFASVVFLSGFEGANGGTTFVDESSYARSVTRVSATTVTAQFKYGATSMITNGGSISLADSTDWYLEPGDFTIETYYRPASIGTRQFLCGQGDSGATSVRNLLEVTAAGKFRYLSNGSSAVSVVGTTTLVANTWYHLLMSKSGNNFRVFVDGNLDTTVNSAATFTDFAGPFYVGKCGAYGSLLATGHFDEFRITKGVARYTASFTPPVAAHPRS